MKETMELPPDPSRMVEGLRDTGYQFNTAVADVIDNSVAAGATFVDIKLEMDYRGNISLAIFDDGCGMDKEALINAMKYGSKPRPTPKSLGKFGLGLKTASTAFCRKLTVVSRSTADAPLLSATWDLDNIRKVNEWELVIDEANEAHQKEFEFIIGKHCGTVVYWDKVDRLLKDHGKTVGAAERRALTKIIEYLRKHLGKVYQRFLDTGDTRERNLKIRLGEQDVMAWDPFAKTESEVVGTESVEVELLDGSKAHFAMTAYVLPRKEDFSSEQAAKTAEISNNNQGIYIYRENRLIHGPDWLQIFTKEPHYSLLRVEFSFDYKLDEAFQIDIKKSQIILNEALYQEVVDFLVPPRRVAEERYRKGTRTKAAQISKNAHDGSNRNINTKAEAIDMPRVDSIDAAKDEATIVNKQGAVKLKLKVVSAARPHEVRVQPVESIDDGLLWEPCLIDGQCGIRINTGHPYYHKVYLPNIMEGVTVQGMDALLWGMALAELSCVSESTKTKFADMRYEVSRNLRKLVEDLPEPAATE